MITELFVKRLKKRWESDTAKRMQGQKFPDDVCIDGNIVYLNGGCQKQSLDVLYPKVGENLPALIVVHGGGLFSSSKEETRYYSALLAQRGFVVFNVDYRLVPDVHLESQIQDVYSAFRWIEKNACSYGVKKDSFALTGDSAGAYLSVLCTAALSSERLRRIYGVRECTMKISAAAFPFGMFNIESENFFIRRLRKICFRRGYKKSEFYKNVIISNLPEVQSLPPCFLISCKPDSLSPMTLNFKRLLEEKGKEHELVFFDNDDSSLYFHDFCVAYPERDDSIKALDAMTDFIKRYV